MQQYYTLEEAADKLDMSPDELREMAKKKQVRAFQDRGTWRFRAQEIDEMVRARGLGSDPEVRPASGSTPRSPKPKSGPKIPAAEDDKIAIDFSLDSGEASKPKSGPKSPKSPTRSPRPAKGDSDVRLVMDGGLDFQIELDSDVRLEESGPKSGSRKKGDRPSDSSVKLANERPSDSDVKVVPDQRPDSDVRPRPGKSPSDSDIRLQDAARAGKRPPSDPGVTEELIDLDAEEARLAQQKQPPAKKPRLTQASNQPALPASSPFELSENDMRLEEPTVPPRTPAKKDKDSSSDFELVPFDKSKSPGDLGSGEIPLLQDDEEVTLGDLARPGAGNSGINLQEPADSGISLEDGGSDEIEFELSLDSGTTPRPAKEAPKSGKPAKPAKHAKPAKPAKGKEDEDSSSEFELSLDESPSDPSSSEFELSLDSSDAIGLQSEESSDSEFELTLDEEGSLGVEDESKDIFEPTNFDVPALDEESGSEAVALDEGDPTDVEGSDFEISLGDEDSSSDSQVVALEGEEEADSVAATVARPRKTASKAKLSGAAVAADEEAELDLDLDRPTSAVEEEADEEEEAVAAAPAAPTEWGPWPVVFLFPAVIVLFIVGLMGFELVQGMYGYNRPARVSKMVINPIARILDESLPKE